MKKKIITILVLISLILPFQMFAADEPQSAMELTLEQAQQLALNNSSQLKTYNKNIKQILETYIGKGKYTYDVSVFSPIEEMNKMYLRLANNSLFLEEEQGELYMLYSMYEGTDYVKNINFEKYFSKEEFPDTSIWYNILSLKIGKEIARYQAADQVRQSFDKIIAAEKQVSLMKENYQNKEKINNSKEIQYKNGTVSRLDKDSAQVDYLTAKLQFDQQNRGFENLKTGFKNLLGLELNKEIILKDYNIKDKYKVPVLNEYIKKALAQRNEITIPKMGLVVNKNQLNQVDLYLRYMPYMDSLLNSKANLENEKMNLEASIEQSEYEITQDVISEYASLKEKQKALDIQSNKLKTALKNYTTAKINYKDGYINSETLQDIKMLWTQADLSYNNSKRQFQYSLERMDSLCGLGIKQLSIGGEK
jgi:hypothetical protein